jgi:predicted ribosome quality control (RQC) complex YloA/Tae2 family protein
MFVKSVSGESPPLDTMLDAGNLALFYSKGKNSGQGDVYYTQVRYLRRVKGGKGGLGIPTREKTLIVRLERESIGILRALSRGVSESRRAMMPTGYSGFS